MSEKENYKSPEIPGVGAEIQTTDVVHVFREVDRLVSSEGNHMKEIARIFDASPETIQDAMRKKLETTRYATF